MMERRERGSNMAFCMQCSREYMGMVCPSCGDDGIYHGRLKVPPKAQPTAAQIENLQIQRWRAEEQEAIRWSYGFWRNSAYQLILDQCRDRGWSKQRFENLVTYGSAEQVRQLGAGGQFFGDPL